MQKEVSALSSSNTKRTKFVSGLFCYFVPLEGVMSYCSAEFYPASDKINKQINLTLVLHFKFKTVQHIINVAAL